MTTPTPPFVSVLKLALQHQEGRDLFRWLLLDACGILRSPMSSTEHDIRYLCGKQDIGYALLELLAQADPSILATLMEATNEKS